MEKTGVIELFTSNAAETQRALRGETSLRRRLYCGLSGLAILAAAALPVTIDQTSLLPAFQSAHAAADAAGGNEDGTGAGQGKGKGNGNGQGGGKHTDIIDDGGDGDDANPGGSDGDDAGPGGGDGDDANPGGRDGDDAGPGGGGGDHNPGELGNRNEADFAEAIAAIGGNPAAALPTIGQVFSMDDSSVLSAEQELLAIQNGWGAPPSK